jgi:hypothetical protein
MVHNKKHRVIRESGMDTGAAKGEATVISSDDVWRNTPWGSRDSFIKERIEVEGYSAEAAEKYAAIWEQGERRVIENKPVVLVSE